MIQPVEQISVLHVDDEPELAETVATFLERADKRFSVRTASSAEEGLQELTDTVDCVISDYEMPGMDGIEFLRAVRETYPDLPFILFTSRGSEAIASDAISADVTDYLRKRPDTEQYELLATQVDSAVGQYHAERKLERQTDLFRKVQETAGVGAWEWYPQEEQGYYSEGVYGIYGVESRPEGGPQSDIETFFHPADRDTIRTAFERAVETGKPYEEEVRLIAADGTEKWVRTSGDPQFEGGECVRISGTVQDITRLRDHRETLATLHTAAAEMQECDSLQAAAEQTVGAAESVLEMELCSLLVHEDGMLVPAAASSEASPGGTRRMEPDQGLAGETFQTGESFVVDDISADDVTDPAKSTYRSGLSVPVGDIGVFQAVSTERAAFDGVDRRFTELLTGHAARTMRRLQFEAELRESQEQLRRQNERLERFVGIASHDLRNPLGVARGRLELARQECDSDHLDAVEGAHERMEQLLEHLLTLAREGGRVEELERVDLTALVRDCWGNVSTPEATLQVETDTAVRADPDRLRQAIENLVRNATEHSDGPIRVTVGDLENGFYVADSGSGIPADERDAIFEYGYSTQDTGTGFGLAIVAEIVDAHDWSVTVSESEAGGARFEITGVDRPG